MPQIVIYPNEYGILAILVPPPGVELPIEQIALKDVPEGRPFRIIEMSDLPEDGQYRNAWEADFTTPDGYGIGHAAWEQANANR
jgi:hypothetical protein